MKQIESFQKKESLNVLSSNTRKAYKIAYNQFIDFSGLAEIEIESMAVDELGRKIVDSFNTHFPNKRVRPNKISCCKNYIEICFNKTIPIKKDRTNGKHKLRQSNKQDLSNKEIESILKLFTNQYRDAVKSKYQNRVISKLRNLILIKLLVFTGQRIGDILNLTVNDARKSKLGFKQEKTGAEIEIENPCLSEILTYLSFTKLDGNDFLFKTGIVSKLSYSHALKTINKACLIAIGKDITPHTFRKYVVTHLKELGFSDKQVMGVTGHVDGRMIGYYTGNGNEPIQDLQNVLLKPIKSNL